jgi:hypothetical protein
VTNGRSTPSRWWYLLIVPPILFGTGVFRPILWRQITATDQAPRFAVPGRIHVPLDEGKYLIFVEPRRAFGVKEASCTVLTAAGASLGVTNAEGTSHFNEDGGGRSLFEFEAPTNGTYDVACASERTGGRVAVVASHGTSVVVALLAFVVIAVGGFLGAFFVFVKRQRAGAPFP